MCKHSLIQVNPTLGSRLHFNCLPFAACNKLESFATAQDGLVNGLFGLVRLMKPKEKFGSQLSEPPGLDFKTRLSGSSPSLRVSCYSGARGWVFRD